MRAGPRLHAYEYLDRPYEAVRCAFAEDAVDALTHATDSARARVVELAETLHATVGPLHFDVPVEVRLRSFEQTSEQDGRASCRLRIEWVEANHPGWFPVMTADIEAHPLTQEETQIALFGEYRPPLGALGRGLDRVGGHRLAEASVHAFVQTLVARLRQSIPGRTAPAASTCFRRTVGLGSP